MQPRILAGRTGDIRGMRALVPRDPIFRGRSFMLVIPAASAFGGEEPGTLGDSPGCSSYSPAHHSTHTGGEDNRSNTRIAQECQDPMMMMMMKTHTVSE